MTIEKIEWLSLIPQKLFCVVYCHTYMKRIEKLIR